jgi:hypothetical protein
MPIVVDARSKADFEAWLKQTAAEQKQAAAPAAASTPTASNRAPTPPIAAAPTPTAESSVIAAPLPGTNGRAVTLAKADAH